MPIVLFIALLVVLVPVVFFSSAKNLWQGSSPTSDIKGLSFHSDGTNYVFAIKSGSGTWELMEYLCVTKAECLESLNSGKKWQSVSGGTADNKEVLFYLSPEDGAGYKYVKVYVRAGWFADKKGLQAELFGSAPEAEIVKFKLENVSYDAVIVPISSVSPVRVAVFSD